MAWPRLGDNGRVPTWWEAGTYVHQVWWLPEAGLEEGTAPGEEGTAPGEEVETEFEAAQLIVLGEEPHTVLGSPC